MSFRTKAIGVICAGCVAASGFVLSQRSETTIAPLRPTLQTVIRCAIKVTPVDFTAYHGFRTDHEHQTMLARGVSWIKRSKHQDGMAVDIMAIDPATGKGTWEAKFYYRIAPAFYACGDFHGVPITWGGEWTKQDLVHFEEKHK